MGYTLYGRRQTGAMAIEVALALTGTDWSLKDLPRPATSVERAALSKINPRGQVPVLIHPDGTVITEGPAILSHLADAFPAAGLAPAPGTSARAWHDRWLGFFHANVYEGMLRELAPGRYTTDTAGAPAVASAATDYVRRHFLIFEAERANRLAKGLIAENSLSTLDIYLWMLCYWMDAAWLSANCPVIAAHWNRLCSLPALHPVAKSHFG